MFVACSLPHMSMALIIPAFTFLSFIFLSYCCRARSELDSPQQLRIDCHDHGTGGHENCAYGRGQ